ncbi:MAG: c-type cytochrome, partial [Armatimonadetes bacterium]|nr:c-type cytochrome [Armatimonadota bacterium]
VYVTEAAEGSVAVVDRASRTVVGHFTTEGEEPGALALTPDGRYLLVANSFSGSVVCLNAASGHKLWSLRLPGGPAGIAVAGGGTRLFVTLGQLDEVAVVEWPPDVGAPVARVARRIPVGRRPRAAALAPDGQTLVVGNLAGGSLSVVDPDAGKELTRVPLRGINLRGLALTPDGKSVYTGVMPAFSGRPTRDPAEIWHNIVQEVVLAGESSGPGENQWLDFVRLPGMPDLVGAPDLHDLAVDPTGRWLYATVAGRDVLTRISIHDPRRDAIWPISQREVVTGANPRGLALSPDGKELWTANYLGNSLTVVDAVGMAPLATVSLGRASRVDPTIQGQYLFHNAGLTSGHRFSCNSCHPDGASDGLVWNFVHVADGFVKRNSRDLRGGIAETAPFRWSGFDKHLREFVEAEVTGLLQGPRPTDEQIAALTQAVQAFRRPPNPLRQPDGEWTPLGRAGRELFQGKGGCVQCHEGTRGGGTGAQRWVGTTSEGRTVDVPHLVGVYDSAPYLHDGRAASLEEIFTRWNGRRAHGRAHLLTAAELKAVLQYVREL